MKEGLDKFLLDDLKAHGGQSSWDWDADLRLAEWLGNAEAVEGIKAAQGTQLFPYAFAIHRKFGNKVKQIRLSGLRQLVQDGLVESWWAGTGEAGGTQLGVNRVRTYHLKENQPGEIQAGFKPVEKTF